MSKFDNIPKDIKKVESHEDRKAIYEKVCNGEINHKQLEASKRNLVPINQRTEEEATAIRRKGWEAMMKIKGERKNAKQILEDFLPIYANDNALDDNELITADIKRSIKKHNVKVTQYELIMLAMISKAQNGDVKASEFIANHFGDTVVKETHNVNESISASDKALIEKISNRLNIIDGDYKEVPKT